MLAIEDAVQDAGECDHEVDDSSPERLLDCSNDRQCSHGREGLDEVELGPLRVVHLVPLKI